jgi:hypothetical protein
MESQGGQGKSDGAGVVILMAACLSFAAAACSPTPVTFTPQAWRDTAPARRFPLASDFVERALWQDMTVETAVAVLGEPSFTWETLSWTLASGHVTGAGDASRGSGRSLVAFHYGDQLFDLDATQWSTRPLQQPFDREAWRSGSPEARTAMVDSILDTRRAESWDLDRLVRELGAPDETSIALMAWDCSPFGHDAHSLRLHACDGVICDAETWRD